ncbi:TPA: BspA family leucine-rich repeat surface protein, partial [Enterococcus faecalis]
MNYKKFISVSFATLLLANTGAPVVANATTSSGAEALDEEVLKDIFDSSTDFNSIKMMNEIKKEQVEEEQPEETEDKKERLDEGTTSDEEATVDKAVEESSKENTDNTESENVSETEISKETEATNAEAVNNSGSDELDTNNTDVNEESLNGQSRAYAESGHWGSASWYYARGASTYVISAGKIGTGVEGLGSNVAPWLRKDSVLLSNDAPEEFYVEFRSKISVGGAMPLFFSGSTLENPEYSFDAQTYAQRRMRAVSFKEPVDCSQMDSFSRVFYKGEHLTNINGLSNIKIEKEMSLFWLFSGCKSLKQVEISGWTIAKGPDMFVGMDSLEYLAMDKIRFIGNNFDALSQTGLGILSNGKESTKLKRVDFKQWETDTITDASGLTKLFSNLTYVETLHLERLLANTTITDLSGFFHGLESVKSLFLNVWDTSNVTSMVSTFEDLLSLERVDTSAWDTSNVTDMRSMFYNCKSLYSLSLEGWNTSKVTTMNSMFAGANNLNYLNLNNWEFREDVDMNFFMTSTNLQTLSMNNIKYHPSNLKLLGGRMFSGRTKLKVLNA